ncbi:Na+/H+ antiporter subunit A [Neobacillus niacini]|uniref:Na+/H+ antiporter subunit A n=1 Tax=Neobacillus niacini TaxID=86668 RepID=UPI0021CAE6F0|nr:Na+/H+ antiporter subunit A [Neobacillus niacini]MCM3765999.1 Na+/H+ antiporter subunit A [Neobacillus niacini]
MSWLHLLILLPFIFAAVVPYIYRKFTPRIHTGWFVLVIPLVIFAFLLSFTTAISNGNTAFSTVPWIPSYNINFTTYVDGLSLIFGLLIAGIGALVILYSIFYMSKREALNNFYVYLLLFMGAMLGLVFSDNIFVLYVFWETTSVSSFLLIAYWYEREKSRYGAQKSMLITIFGGLTMLAGLIMLSMMTETYSIREMVSQAANVPSHSLFVPSMILILIGAFTKSAQFPFSIWLPDAMEAPTPISAYLHSATMVKAGIYLVARLTPVFGGQSEWFWIVSSVGMITLLYGSVNAVRQTDLKALLAYSTISQLGLIMSLLGLGSASLYTGGEESSVYMAAIFAAIFHLVNHSTFKGCLFMVVGIIDHETGTRDIRRLGGLMHLMPISFTLAVIGSFSMAGLPPFNGFLSKEMFFTAVINAAEMKEFGVYSIGNLFPIIAWIASVFTFVYSMILVFKTFRGKNKPEKLAKEVHEAPLGMLISPIVLGLFVVIIFFFPNILSKYLLSPALAAIVPTLAAAGETNVKISAWHGWNIELFMTIGVIVLGTIMYHLLKKWYRIYLFYPENLTLNHLYNIGLENTEAVSRRVTDRYMTGFIRDYLVYIFAFIIVIVGGAVWLSDGLTIQTSGDAPVNWFEAALMIVMIITAAAVLFAKTRLKAILAVGGLGFLVSFFFVLFRAPDLALTQLVVETVTTVLFLLCFYHLPQLRKEFARIQFKAVNAIVSIGVGAVVTIVALSANGKRLFQSISGYYENSYELAGAKNIVNSILVDFRGIDTMLEILVLSIAGLGVYTLIKLRLAGGDSNEKVK